MMRTPTRSYRGLTLIEVLAGLAILGTLLSGVVMASVRLQRQRALAYEKLQAVEATDALLETWFSPSSPSPSSSPTATSGDAGGDDDPPPGRAIVGPVGSSLPRFGSGRIDERFVWRLETLDADVLGAGAARRARLRVFASPGDEGGGRGGEEGALVSVDLFLPLEETP